MSERAKRVTTNEVSNNEYNEYTARIAIPNVIILLPSRRRPTTISSRQDSYNAMSISHCVSLKRPGVSDVAYIRLLGS